MKKVSILLVLVLAIGAVSYWGYLDNTSEDDGDNTQSIESSSLENKDDEDKPKAENNNSNTKGASALTEDDLVRMDGQGPVDVAVVLNNVLEDDPESLVFKMYLNTHSVPLDEINYSQIASVKVNDEITIAEGFKWEIVGGSGHHIQGYLKVPKEYKGNKLFDENTQSIELELKDIGGVPLKTFVWNLGELQNQ